MVAALEVRRLNSGYLGAPVVWDVDFEVAPGEVVAILGPNGAGKTTTLLTVGGVLRALGGQVRVCGEDVTGLAAHRIARLGVALVPDDRALLPSLSVAETFRLVRDPRLDPLTVFAELVPLMRRRCGLLSGGEQQMVALARAIMTQPKLLLIDELSLGLGPLVVQRLFRVIKETALNEGTAVVLVEQHVQQALANADRAYVMVHGRVVLKGRAEELRTQRELLASTYLASMQGVDG